MHIYKSQSLVLRLKKAWTEPVACLSRGFLLSVINNIKSTFRAKPDKSEAKVKKHMHGCHIALSQGQKLLRHIDMLCPVGLRVIRRILVVILILLLEPFKVDIKFKGWRIWIWNLTEVLFWILMKMSIFLNTHKISKNPTDILTPMMKGTVW